MSSSRRQSRRQFVQYSALFSALSATSSLHATTSTSLGSAGESTELDGLLHERTRRVLQLSREHAELLGHQFVGSEHLLLGLAAEAEESDARWLGNLGLESSDFSCAAYHVLQTNEAARRKESPSTNFVASLEVGKQCALRMGHQQVTPEHLLLGVVDGVDSGACRLLEEMWLERGAFRTAAIAELNGVG